jgi:hypothetical protein
LHLREKKMADHGILEILGKRGILSSLMESPLYFSIHLRERLRLIQQLGGQIADYQLRGHMLSWVKTGYFPGLKE